MTLTVGRCHSFRNADYRRFLIRFYQRCLHPYHQRAILKQPTKHANTATVETQG